MTTTSLPVSLRPAKAEVSPAARRAAAADQDDDGKKTAFDHLLHDATASDDSKKAAAKDTNYGDVIRAKAIRERADDGTTAAMRAAGETARDLPPPPLLIWTASANQSGSDLPPPPVSDTDEGRSVENAADTAASGTQAASADGAASRQAAKSSPTLGEPYAPPPDLSDELPSDPATTATAPKLSPIRPHGPPVSSPAQGTEKMAAGGGLENVASQTESLKTPIAPHGPPPTARNQTSVAPQAGTSQGEFIRPTAGPASGTATAAADQPVNRPVETVVTDTDPTAFPILTTSSPNSVSETPANPAVFANTPVAVTTAAQISMTVGAAAAAVEEESTAETSPVLAPGAASLAPRTDKMDPKDKTSRVDQSSQITGSKELKQLVNPNGTATAKPQTKMTGFPTTTDRADGSRVLPEQNAALAFGLPDHRSEQGRAEKASTLLSAVGAAVTPFAMSSVPVNAPANAAPATGIVEVDKVESLLQTVQQTAEKIRLEGHGQLELRVRLNGVADDVTVRLRVDGRQHPQVSFQTNSPKLREALERGWNDLLATTPTPTPVNDARSAAASAPSAVTNPAASPSVQPRPGPDDSRPGPTDVWRRDQTRSAAEAGSTTSAEPARRWSGWA